MLTDDELLKELDIRFKANKKSLRELNKVMRELKVVNEKPMVIEINDNPNIDVGVEDEYYGDLAPLSCSRPLQRCDRHESDPPLHYVSLLLLMQTI